MITGSVMGLANEHLFVEFRELWSEGPATRCGDLRQSFTDTLACSSVGQAFSEINEGRSTYLVDRLTEGDEILHIGSSGIAVYQCRDWLL